MSDKKPHYEYYWLLLAPFAITLLVAIVTVGCQLMSLSDTLLNFIGLAVLLLNVVLAYHLFKFFKSIFTHKQ